MSLHVFLFQRLLDAQEETKKKKKKKKTSKLVMQLCMNSGKYL